MAVNSVLSYAAFSRLTPSNDDVLSDRVSHLYTVILLVIFTIIVGIKQFVGDPIQCLIPEEFKPHQNAYVLSTCWITNTYYIKDGEVIPRLADQRKATQILYYQWVPIILLFMAFLFKLPYVFWRMLCEQSGFNVSVFVSLALKNQYGNPEDHDKNSKNISDYLDRWLEFNKKVVTLPARGGRGDGKQRYLLFEEASRWYLMLLYYFIKMLYSVNAVAQLFLLNSFLGEWFTLFGSEIIKQLVRGEPFKESHRFPRETFCDYVIRQQQNHLTYTSMCVLPINLFNEKIFIFIWFWLVIVSIISIISFLKWTRLIFFRRRRIVFVGDYLQLLNILCGEQDKNHVKSFVLDYLKGDGVFILKMLDANCGPVITSDVVKHLWYLYRIRPVPITAASQF